MIINSDKLQLKGFPYFIDVVLSSLVVLTILNNKGLLSLSSAGYTVNSWLIKKGIKQY